MTKINDWHPASYLKTTDGRYQIVSGIGNNPNTLPVQIKHHYTGYELKQGDYIVGMRVRDHEYEDKLVRELMDGASLREAVEFLSI